MATVPSSAERPRTSALRPGGLGSADTRAPLREAAAVTGLCLAVAIVFNALLAHQVGFSGDEPYYARIARHPAGPHNFPYAFRVGLPYLVHVLPFSHAFSWEALALTAAAVAGGALYALMREFAIDRLLAASLAVAFVISPPLLVVFLRNGIEVDAAAIMIITLGTLFIVRRSLPALGMTILVGTSVHESCLFLIPLAYAVWAQRLVDTRALRDVARVGVLPAVFYLYLRGSIAAVGKRYQPGYNGPFLTERVDVLKDALGHGGWRGELRRLALAYGPLWIVAPFAIGRLRFARRGLVLCILCAASMTFALDWGRMAFFAAPVVYVSAAYVLRDRRRLALLCVLALLAVDVGYAAYMQVHGVKHGLDSTAPPARGPVT
jgi:hypothetical protein